MTKASMKEKWNEAPDWLKWAVLLVGGIATGGGANSFFVVKSDPAVISRVQAVEIKQEGQQKQLDRMETKLDRLLERGQRSR